MIQQGKLIKLKLKRDLTRKIKQGHPWIFDDALLERPSAPAGSMGKLLDRKNKTLAFGIYDSEGPLSFRAMTCSDSFPDERLIQQRLDQAISLRKYFQHDQTSGYRLINGEGDLLPGLVVDIFARHAVLQLDGAGPYGFYDRKKIADYLYESLELEGVFFKARNNSTQKSEILTGKLLDPNIVFKENGITFSCHVIEGQKTGFFLDQRDNRLLIKKISEDLNVLNLFSYTGGFSVYAGLGKAKSVTSVDISRPASENCAVNWKLNHLGNNHEIVCENCFDFISKARSEKKKWDLVIVDPPSFASSQKSRDKAMTSYQKVFSESLRLCENSGLFAASSCSSHIGHDLFLEICQKSLSESRRRGQIIYDGRQGTDHPFPVALPEMRYLKFILFKLD